MNTSLNYGIYNVVLYIDNTNIPFTITASSREAAANDIMDKLRGIYPRHIFVYDDKGGVSVRNSGYVQGKKEEEAGFRRPFGFSFNKITILKDLLGVLIESPPVIESFHD